MQTIPDTDKDRQFLPKDVPEYQKKREKMTNRWEKYVIQILSQSIIVILGHT